MLESLLDKNLDPELLSELTNLLEAFALRANLVTDFQFTLGRIGAIEVGGSILTQ